MNLGEILEATKAARNGTDITEFVQKINDVLHKIAESCDIPFLKVLTTIETVEGQAYAFFPQDFSRLKYVSMPGSEESIVVLDGGMSELEKRYPGLDTVGDVVMVTVEDDVLWYQGIPETPKTLVVIYVRRPTPLLVESDCPTFLPEYLHNEVLVSFLNGDTERYNAGMGMLSRWVSRRDVI